MLGAGLKAGIIMGIVAAVITLLVGVATFLPTQVMTFAQCCSLVVFLALWFVSGILAARFAPAALTTGAAAGGGAVAGAITQVIGGIVDTLVTLVVSIVKPAAAIPPETMQQLTELGLSPQDMQTLIAVTSPGPLGALATCLCCAGVGAVLAAGLGALGGIVGKAISGGKGQ